MRLTQKLEKNLNLVTYLVRRSPENKVIAKFVLHWSDKGITGLPGAQLTGFVDELVKKGISVAIITTSIMSSSIKVSEYGGIVLHPTLERIEYRVVKLRRVYGFNVVNNPVVRNSGLMKIFDI